MWVERRDRHDHQPAAAPREFEAPAERVGLGDDPRQRPKSDRLAPRVLALIVQGRSYRLVGREVGLSKNTVADIINRHRN